eukprot:m.98320 g.98320  ORF g.98320 m.98320 type:complete len:130 (-) comp51395_c1_seq1:235-624(-)
MTSRPSVRRFPRRKIPCFPPTTKSTVHRTQTMKISTKRSHCLLTCAMASSQIGLLVVLTLRIHLPLRNRLAFNDGYLHQDDASEARGFRQRDDAEFFMNADEEIASPRKASRPSRAEMFDTGYMDVDDQ